MKFRIRPWSQFMVPCCFSFTSFGFIRWASAQCDTASVSFAKLLLNTGYILINDPSGLYPWNIIRIVMLWCWRHFPPFRPCSCGNYKCHLQFSYKLRCYQRVAELFADVSGERNFEAQRICRSYIDAFDFNSWVGRDSKPRGFSSKCRYSARLGFRVEWK